MTDREQAIKDFVEFSGSNALLVCDVIEKPSSFGYRGVAYAVSQRERVIQLERALRLIFDAVDYTKGNCRINEMVGAVLPNELITSARAALENK